MSLPRIHAILDFWFGPDRDYIAVDAVRSSLWFGKHPDIDNAITVSFKPDLQTALHGGYDHWMETQDGLLALVILLDQFSRNIYRGSAAAFNGDARVLELTLSVIREKTDLRMPPLQRVFLYMPLQHAEDIDMQTLSVIKFQSVSESVPAAYKPAYKNFLDFAIQHKQIIEQFGRFPHRNIILGRTSSQAEQQFLQQPGSSF